MTWPRPGPDDAAPSPATPAVAGGTAAAAEALAELPADTAFLLWRVLRTVQLWAADDPDERGRLLDAEEVERWEEGLLTAAFDADLRLPLAVIVGELARGDRAVSGRVSWACLCVTDWALARGASRTALAFAEAAALASPEQPRYAWVSGRMLRTFGRFRDSERWLRRAVGVAARKGDWEAQARGLNSLGNTALHRGDYRDAERLLRTALRTARRRGLRTAEAECLHDLYAVRADMGDWTTAEEHARGAYELYRTLNHPQLPMFAHDMAYMWLNRGYFSRALQVLLALRPLPLRPEGRLRVLSSAIRAAGASGAKELLEKLWDETWPLAAQAASEKRYASALVEMGVGASSLSQWERAAGALELALELAGERGETDMIFRAETALAAVRAGKSAETVRSAPTGATAPGDALARSMVSSLEEAAR